MHPSRLLSLLLFFTVATTMAQLPEPMVPFSVGINVHFLSHGEKDLDMIASAGFRFIRRDFAWAETEKAKGVYDFSSYDILTAELDKRGMRALYLLSYSNPLYEPDGVSPQHPESVQAFAKWAAAAATHFKGRKVVWEVWNEPNLGFWKPKVDVGQYAALLLATGKEIRAADPAATIVGPGSATFAFDFLEPLFKAGALEYLDGVTIHPYPPGAPEMVAPDYLKLRQLITRYAPKGRNIAIVSGESGYSTFEGGGSVRPEQQAQYIVRQQLWNLACGVPLSIWFSWKDAGTQANEREQNFGLVLTDLKPKPAYAAVQTMNRELMGFRFVRRVEVATKKDFVLLFKNAQNVQKLAIWTSGEPHKLRLPGSSSDLNVSGAPQYLIPRGLSL